MKSELNDYKITNKDGIIKGSNDGKVKYNNDNPHYFKENSLSNQNEYFDENESFDSGKKNVTENKKTSNEISKSTSSSTTTATTSTTATTTSTVTSSTTAISSSLGSIVGGVTSSIATAVIVVAAFVSMLTINIALVMAGTNSLVFKLEMTGAQKEDFENKTYYAVLEGNGYKQSQEIFMDSVYITFDDLEPGTEYKITIKNDEKVFVEKSYFTATNDTQRGFVEVSSEINTVYAFVGVRDLKSNEFYTFTATDSQGKVLFQNSDIASQKEYSFEIEKPDTISFTLSIDGKVCCFEQYYVEFEPTGDDPSTEDPTGDTHSHNYIPRGFVWDYDDQGNLIAFGEGVCSDCEDVLRLPTELTRDGDLVVASIIYNGTKYTDSRVEIDLTGKENVISANNQYIIKPNSYVLGNLDSENTVTYRNNSEHPYIIKGTADGILNCINIYNSGLSIPDVGYKSDYYFEFNNLNISADSDSSSTIFSVQTKYDVTIHIAIRGEVSFTTNNAPSFNVINDGDNDVVVTFDVTYINEDNSLSCYDNNLSDINIYNEQSGVEVVFNINGTQVDSNGKTVSQSDVENKTISLNEGPIHISANGYARQESDLSNPTEFVSSADNPYLIENQEIDGCDNIINVYQNNQNIGTADIYIKLKDVTIKAGNWCSLFRIVATNTLNIHLIIEGNVTFVGGSGQQVFSSQGNNSPTVTIIIDQTTAGGTFNAETPNGLTYAQSGTINVRYV